MLRTVITGNSPTFLEHEFAVLFDNAAAHTAAITVFMPMKVPLNLVLEAAKTNNRVNMNEEESPSIIASVFSSSCVHSLLAILGNGTAGFATTNLLAASALA